MKNDHKVDSIVLSPTPMYIVSSLQGCWSTGTFWTACNWQLEYCTVRNLTVRAVCAGKRTFCDLFHSGARTSLFYDSILVQAKRCLFSGPVMLILRTKKVCLLRYKFKLLIMDNAQKKCRQLGLTVRRKFSSEWGRCYTLKVWVLITVKRLNYSLS